MTNSKILAISKVCGPCCMLLSRLKKLSLEVEIKDFTNNEDIKWFRENNIKNVPRLVIKNREDTIIIQGMDEIIEALKNDK